MNLLFLHPFIISHFRVNVIKKAIRKEEEAQKAIRDKKAAKPVVDKGIGKHKWGG